MRPKTNPLIDAMDQMMRALTLEGALGRPLGCWGFRCNPLGQAEKDIGAESPELAQVLRERGWFDRRASCLYPKVAGFLAKFTDAQVIDDVASEILLRPATGRAPTRSYAHDAGKYLAEQGLEVTLEKAGCVLSTIAMRKAIDRRRAVVSRSQRHEEPIGLACDLPEIKAPDHPEPLRVLYRALTDVQDPLGARLRSHMRRVFAEGYSRMRRSSKAGSQDVPPMIRFVEILEQEGRWPCYSEMGRQYGMAERCFTQRHLRPLFEMFFRSVSPKMREEVTQELCRRGCVLDKAEQWAAGGLA